MVNPYTSKICMYRSSVVGAKDWTVCLTWSVNSALSCKVQDNVLAVPADLTSLTHLSNCLVLAVSKACAIVECVDGLEDLDQACLPP